MDQHIPIACTLTPSEFAARRAGLLPGLAQQASRIDQVDGGVRLVFATNHDINAHIARVVAAESRCCAFLQFDIAHDLESRTTALTITAPPEAQQLLQDLVAPSTDF